MMSMRNPPPAAPTFMNRYHRLNPAPRDFLVVNRRLPAWKTVMIMAMNGAIRAIWPTIRMLRSRFGTRFPPETIVASSSPWMRSGSAASPATIRLPSLIAFSVVVPGLIDHPQAVAGRD